MLRSETKRSEIQVYFFVFFRFFSFFFAFFTFFRLIFVSLRFFHLIFAYITFVFASDFWCFASKWIMWNQAFFSLRSETKFSLLFQISLPKRKWGRTLHTYLQTVGIELNVFSLAFSHWYKTSNFCSHLMNILDILLKLLFFRNL